MKVIPIIFSVYAAKVYAECWSEKLGYPCCPSANTNVVYTDKEGEWGYINGEWCGILKYVEPTTFPSPTTKKNCPTFSFPLNLCSKKGRATTVTYDDCPTPTCIIEQECWSEKLGYSCCSYINDNAIYIDEDGEWGNENGKWCGILKDIVPTSSPSPLPLPLPLPSPSPSPSPTTKKNCATFSFPVNECTKKGRLTVEVKDGCPTPTCVIEQECWSEKLGYPCCSYTNNNVVYSDKDGEWGLTNDGDWCGILKDLKASPTIPKNCPIFSFPYNSCVKKGKPSQIYNNGCPTPTCVIEQECWSEKLGYPCCPFIYSGETVIDDRGEWGFIDGQRCGVLKDI